MPQFLKNRLRDVAVILGVAAVLTFFGVYTNNEAVWIRFLMWAVTCTVGGVTSGFVIPLIFERKIAGDLLAVQAVVAAAIISVPVLVSLYLFIGAFGHWVPLYLLPMQYLYVFAVSLALTLIGVLTARAREPASAPSPETGNVAARFLDRLPVKYRGADLWAISSEDHYLRIHTSRGEELILMRLADAVRELDGAAGVQVHRSWWVARDGISEARRTDGKLVLVLKSGKEVPVSRTYAKAARDAGLA